MFNVKVAELSLRSVVSHQACGGFGFFLLIVWVFGQPRIFGHLSISSASFATEVQKLY